jgi:hypothetical protein
MNEWNEENGRDKPQEVYSCTNQKSHSVSLAGGVPRIELNRSIQIERPGVCHVSVFPSCWREFNLAKSELTISTRSARLAVRINPAQRPALTSIIPSAPAGTMTSEEPPKEDPKLDLDKGDDDEDGHDDDDDDDDGEEGEGKHKKRKERLEQNRLSARESRKRKKTMIEELQRTVITLSRENKELNERNEQLRRNLMEIGTKVRTRMKIASWVRHHVGSPTDPTFVTAC